MRSTTTPRGWTVIIKGPAKVVPLSGPGLLPLVFATRKDAREYIDSHAGPVPKGRMKAARFDGRLEFEIAA